MLEERLANTRHVLNTESNSSKDVHSLAVDGGLTKFEYASKAWSLVS